MSQWLVALIVTLLFSLAYASDKRKRREVEAWLRNEVTQFSGRIVPGTLLVYPKLLTTYRGVEITVSGMPASGGERSHRRSTFYTWFKWDQLKSHEFQIEGKGEHRVGINPRPRLRSGNARVDSHFDIYAARKSHELVSALLGSGLGSVLVDFTERNGTVRLNCVKGDCVLSIPFLPDGSSRGTALIELTMGVIDILLDFRWRE